MKRIKMGVESEEKSMDANKRKYQMNNAMYVSGSAARKLSVAPERERRQYEERIIEVPSRRQQPNNRPSHKPEVSRGIDFVSMMVLLVAIVATLFVCIEYLKVQSGIIQMDKEIVSLEKNLSKLKDTNDAMSNSLAASLDLDEIYTIAVGELGMVFPNKNQVRSYEKNDAGYVRQYGEIPEVDAKSILDKLLP